MAKTDAARAALEGIIRSGASVNLGNGFITRVEDLPDDAGKQAAADLAAENAALRARVAALEAAGAVPPATDAPPAAGQGDGETAGKGKR